jgi:hypothetical protein
MSGRTSVTALGLGDCERRRDGVLAQPANALSSLSFVPVGMWIAARALRRPRSPYMVLLASSVIANGVGSFLYHGPQPRAAKWVHDTAIASLLLAVAAGRSERAANSGFAPRPYAAALAGSGTLLAFQPDVVTLLTPALTGACLAAEGVSLGRRRRLGWDGRRRRGHGVTLTLAGLTGVAFWAGRTDSPLCRPGSFLQWHAVAHVLAALTLGLYAEHLDEPPGRRASRG